MNETSLQALLQRNAELTKAARFSILRQAAEALDAAHWKQTVHGNLSPASVVIREEPEGVSQSFRPGSVTLRDFGKNLDLDKEIAGSDSVPESAYYASPERILGIPLDFQSDEFSLAVIAYELVGGTRPFEAGEVSQLFFQICSAPRKPIEELDPHLTPAVGAVFERALAKEREQRFTTCAEFVRALGNALSLCPGWEGVNAAPPPQPAAAPPPVIPPRREPQYDLPPLNRRRIPLEVEEDNRGSWAGRVALIAAICLFLAGGTYFYMNRRPAPNPATPTQVLDPNAGQSSPPPGEAESGTAVLEKESNTPRADESTAANGPEQTPAATVPPPDQPSAKPPAAPQVSESKTTEATPPPAESPRPIVPARKAPATIGGLANVDLLTEPPGGKLVIDNNGALTCTAPCNMQLSNGRHTLVAEMPGYGMAQRVFDVPDENTLYIPLVKRTGALIVTSTPNSATILIDGKNAGQTPATLHLAPGSHVVTLVNGSQRYQSNVNVVADGIQATGYTFTNAK